MGRPQQLQNLGQLFGLELIKLLIEWQDLHGEEQICQMIDPWDFGCSTFFSKPDCCADVLVGLSSSSICV